MDEPTNNANSTNINQEQEQVNHQKEKIKLAPLELQLPEVPRRLKEEMIHYLYMNHMNHFVDHKVKSHIDVAVFPTPTVGGLFDKAKFYNLAIQKTIAQTASKFTKEMINYIESIFTINPSSKLSPFLSVAKELLNNYESNSSYYKTAKSSTLLFVENSFSIDRKKSFVYLDSSNPQPNNMYLSDNQFYSTFSNKYPNYYNSFSSLPQDKFSVYSYEKTCTSLDSTENFCEIILDAMQNFALDVDANAIEESNRILLNKYEADKQEFLTKLRQQQSQTAEGENQAENPQPINEEEQLKENVPYPTLNTKAANPTNFKDTMVLFVCEEKEEINKQEQINLINELYTKQ